jgi:hypothetical protein
MGLLLGLWISPAGVESKRWYFRSCLRSKPLGTGLSSTLLLIIFEIQETERGTGERSKQHVVFCWNSHPKLTQLWPIVGVDNVIAQVVSPRPLLSRENLHASSHYINATAPHGVVTSFNNLM